MDEIEYQRMRECEDRHWWYATLHELILYFVAGEFRARGPLTIFDAGCGTGGLLAQLAPFGDVSGCDFSPHALAHCRERGLANVTQQDLNELALPPESFDLITCIDVIENAWIKSDAALLARLYAALKPGGVLLLNATAFEFLRSTHDEAVLSSRRYTAPHLQALLAAAGFRVEKITYRLFLLFLPIALFRLAKRLSHRTGTSAPPSDVWLPPAILNALLRQVGRIENALQRSANLPFGTSVFALARKP